MELVRYLVSLFEQHGYLVVFLGLLLEFVALPFPGETTMAYAGYLAYKGLLHWPLLIVCAFFGTTLGMTLTYWVGKKAGYPFIRRFGKWFFLPPHKLETAHKWFDKYGYFLIFISYFIPGVRHITGYFSGIIHLSFRKFISFAYAGALIWTTLFVGIGKIFGPSWNHMFKLATRSTLILALTILGLIAIILVIRFRKSLYLFFTGRLHKKHTAAKTSKSRP